MKKIILLTSILALATACNSKPQTFVNVPLDVNNNVPKQNRDQSSGQKTHNPVPAQTPKPGWKIYTNARYGYSFMYPSDAIVSSIDTSSDASRCVSIKDIIPGPGLVTGNRWWIDMRAPGALSPCGYEDLKSAASVMPLTDSVTINGKKYKITGYTGIRLPFLFSFNFTGKIKVSYGPEVVGGWSLTGDEYDSAIKAIKEVLQTLKTINTTP